MVILHLSRVARYLLLGGLILLALITSFVRFFLSDISEFKAELEQKIRETTHITLHIGKLRASVSYFTPSVMLQDIEVEKDNSATQPAIELKEIVVSINLLQLLSTADILNASSFSLIGAKLKLVRYQDGNIAIAGIKSSDSKPDWLMQAKKYQLLHSDISWEDLKNHQETVIFHNVDVLLKNDQQQHEIHALTTLPEQFGKSLRISALLTGNIFDVQQLDGQIYIEGKGLQGPAWGESNVVQDFKLQSGSGDIRVWSDWNKGSAYRIAAYFQAQQFNLANSAGKILKLDALQGHLSWLNNETGWRLSAYDLDIVADQQHWTDGEFYFHKDLQSNLAMVIKKLNLAALAHVTPLFISEDKQLDQWLQLNPSGWLSNFSVYVQADFQQFALQGSFSDLGNASVNSIPHIQGLSGYIKGTNTWGRINLVSDKVSIDTPDLFRNPLVNNVINGSIDWQQFADSWLLTSRELQINSPDFQTEFDFDLTLPKLKNAPKLNLLMSFSDFTDISKISTYLPAKAMGKDAVNWLDQAFVSGQINQGEVIIQGDLSEFPFENGRGRFDALFTIENAEIQYNPQWPMLQEINADIHFSEGDLQVAIQHGVSKNVDISQALINIPALKTSKNVQVKGVLQSQIQDALIFLQQTPLRSRAEPLLKTLSFDGNTQIDLDLNLPYYETDPLWVNVVSHLNNAHALVKPTNLKFSNIKGNINFSADRVNSQSLTASTLGYPVLAVLNSDTSAAHLKMAGSTDMANLRRQFSFLNNDMTAGSLSYQADLSFPYAISQPSSLQIISNLQGFQIIGQDYLAKKAEEQRLLKLNFLFDSKTFLPLQIQYGDRLNAALLIDTQQSHLFAAHVILGNEVANLPQNAGLFVEIKQPEFKLSDAMDALNEHDDRWPPLREFLLETQNMQWQGQNLGAMECHFQHHDQVWQGTINNVMAKGNLSIPDQYAGNEPIKLDMDVLNLSSMSAFNINAAQQVFSILPLIDIDSRQVLWRSVNLGKLKLQTERLNNGTHFKKISFTGADKDIDFTADWIKQVHGTSTLLNGSLKVNNFGQFLSDLGYSDDFKETRAELSFTGGWNDDPQQFSLDKLNGQLQVKLYDGRISSIEPGFGRLLGLISMEQWAKRLSLDFSDIYRQGLAFDKISGDFKITNGIAYTDNLLIDAVSAKMRMVGTADLVKKFVQQRVVVVPKSSDALPIAGTIVDSIATIITSAVINDYKEGYFFGSEYKVAGQWGNIEVTPLKENDGLLNKTWHGLTDFDWLKK
ncbi:YhdP family protein [Methylomonas sp. AM2-LC]|uniref:YhdP family protein n=1 Tax=Methylomonas sp. AM2-LC TaxID=3153301 RepID=UPI0032649DB0